MARSDVTDHGYLPLHGPESSKPFLVTEVIHELSEGRQLVAGGIGGLCPLHLLKKNGLDVSLRINSTNSSYV